MQKNIPLFIAFEGIDAAGKDTLLNMLLPLFFDENLHSTVFISKGQEVLRTREPTTKSKYSQQIQDFLNGKQLNNINDIQTLCLKDRLEHSQEIKAALAKKQIILCSRYDLSTYAYFNSEATLANNSQATAFKNYDDIYKQHNYNKEGGAIIPDITFFFDLNEEVAFKRLIQRNYGDLLSKKAIDIIVKEKISIELLQRFEKILLNKETLKKLKHLLKSVDIFETLTTMKKVRENYQTVIQFLKEQDNRNIQIINGNQEKHNILKNIEIIIKDYISKHYE